jgi:hypothetical protein
LLALASCTDRSTMAPTSLVVQRMKLLQLRQMPICGPTSSEVSLSFPMALDGCSGGESSSTSIFIGIAQHGVHSYKRRPATSGIQIIITIREAATLQLHELHRPVKLDQERGRCNFGHPIKLIAKLQYSS